jgi:hypothetical protein
MKDKLDFFVLSVVLENVFSSLIDYENETEFEIGSYDFPITKGNC